MAGRRRKPHKMRVLEGGRGKSRPLTPDLAAPTDPLVAPKGLSKREAVVWAQHVTWIRQLGVESGVDAGQILAMVRFYCRAVEADEHIAEHGLTTVTPANGVIQVPEVAISERCWKAYLSTADKFGLSPTARAKLGGDQGKKPERAGDLPPELRDASAQ